MKPLGTEQWAKVGDVVEVKVKVNAGSEVSGESAYVSGPGLYQAQDQETPCGVQGAHSAMVFIGNLYDEKSGPRRVIVYAHDGKFGTAVKGSDNQVWDYGQYVTLRIEYVGAAEGKHTYRYSYDVGSGWVELGLLDFQQKLPYVGPMHYWAGLEGGQRTHYPLLDWARFTDFSLGRNSSFAGE